MDLKVTENMRVGLQVEESRRSLRHGQQHEVSPGYTVVDLDARYRSTFPGFETAEVQLNVINLLDEEYYGNISSGTGRHFGRRSIRSAPRAR